MKEDLSLSVLTTDMTQVFATELKCPGYKRIDLSAKYRLNNF